MHKCYTFLIFMVLLLPSLGLSRWVAEDGMGAGVGGWIDGQGELPLPLQSWGTHVCGGIPRGSWTRRLLPWCSGPFQALTHISLRSSSLAWTSSSAGSLTRNSWLRQLFGLSE